MHGICTLSSFECPGTQSAIEQLQYAVYVGHSLETAIFWREKQSRHERPLHSTGGTAYARCTTATRHGSTHAFFGPRGLSSIVLPASLGDGENRIVTCGLVVVIVISGNLLLSMTDVEDNAHHQSNQCSNLYWSSFFVPRKFFIFQVGIRAAFRLCLFYAVCSPEYIDHSSRRHVVTCASIAPTPQHLILSGR